MYIHIKACYFVTQISSCQEKMYIITTTVLLLTICDLSTMIGISKKENGELHIYVKNGQFLETIREWFGNVQNHIHKLFNPTTTMEPIPPTTEILNINKPSLQKRNGWHSLNLSTTSFDPEQDWGFHIGNWYFIRKDFKDQYELEDNFNDSDFQFSSTIETIGSAQIETEETFDIISDPASTELSSANLATTMLTTHNPITLMPQQTQPQTRSQVTEISNPTENPALNENAKLNYNKTQNNFAPQVSTEVLMG